MSRLVLWGSIVAYSTGFLLGCGSEKQMDPVSVEEHADHEHLSQEKTEMNESFSDLSPADQKLAEAQKICPVSEQPLGSMGTPIKVVDGDRQLFVCCEGCVDKAKESFDEYLSKLDIGAK
jgi:hypothetical protein